MRALLRIVSLVTCLNWFAAEACAEVVIRFPISSSSESSLYGDGPGTPFVGYDFETGGDSAFSGFPVVSTFGFTGSISASTTMSESHDATSLSVSASNSSSIVFANPFGGGTSFGSTWASSGFEFSTDLAMSVTLTFDAAWSLGTWDAGNGFAATFSRLEISSSGSLLRASIAGGAESTNGVVEFDRLVGFSSTSTWGGGNLVTLTITPGLWRINAYTESSASFDGAGEITDPEATGTGGIAAIPAVAVPEPTALVMLSTLALTALGLVRTRRP